MTARTFWSQVTKTATCWLWVGPLTRYGYGDIRSGKGKHIGAHRFLYEWAVGEIPDGLFVLHRCDVRNCVRPDHLFLGTAKDNAADMVAKGRQCLGEKNKASKLTYERVRDARARHGNGAATLGQLARECGVSESVMGRALRGATWRDA